MPGTLSWLTEDLIAMAEGMSRDAFEARVQVPSLLVRRADPVLSAPGIFDTDVGDVRRGSLPPSAGAAVHPVLERGASAFTGKVWVGRAANCDVRLKGSSVSKLHAFLAYDSERRRWNLSDAGSTNGTFVNGVRLKAHASESLAPADTIQFGEVVATFLDPGLLYDWLRRPSKVPRTRRM
jgi:hypothetical protein